MNISALDLIFAPKRVHEKVKVKENRSGHIASISFEIEGGSAFGGRFTAYASQRLELMESFSSGLRFTPAGGRPRVLLRVNGVHGWAHSNPDGTMVEGSHCHHWLTERALRKPLPEAKDLANAVNVVPQVATLFEAWEHLCRVANVDTCERIDKMIRGIAQRDQEQLCFEHIV